MELCQEKQIFKRCIELVIQNSKIEDIQSDSVNMNNVLEPISYLSVIDYPNSCDLLVTTLSSCADSFTKAKDTEADKAELLRNVKQCCWAIILASEFVRTMQENRIKTGEDLTFLENDVSLCSQIFAISQITGVENEANIKRSLLIFFRSFAESFFLDSQIKPDTTETLWQGEWLIYEINYCEILQMLKTFEIYATKSKQSIDLVSFRIWHNLFKKDHLCFTLIL